MDWMIEVVKAFGAMPITTLLVLLCFAVVGLAAFFIHAVLKLTRGGGR